MAQLIPKKYLQGKKKVLFLSSFALGDYVYMRTYFRALAAAYPHLRIDFFRDEPNRTWKWWRWEGLKRYILYEWLERDGIFHSVYKNTYSKAAFKESIKSAQEEQYDVVVSLCKSNFYARLARRIGQGSAYVVGLAREENTVNYAQQIKRWWFGNLLDQTLCIDNKHDGHVNDLFADWFEQFFGLQLSLPERRPSLTVATEWQQDADQTIEKVCSALPQSSPQRIIFVNPYAATWRRNWPLDAVHELLVALNQRYVQQSFLWVVNAPRDHYEATKNFFNGSPCLINVYVFTAQRHFFQLPAMVQCCDAVISVDTSTVHFAGALSKPIVALMRSKNLSWQPWDKDRGSVVVTSSNSLDYITVAEVLPVVTAMLDKLLG